MPAARKSVPVSTRSMSLRPAPCIAFSLPGSSGAGALVIVELRDELRILLHIRLDRVLRQREVARDVDDVDRDRGSSASPACASAGSASATAPRPARRDGRAQHATALCRFGVLECADHVRCLLRCVRAHDLAFCALTLSPCRGRGEACAPVLAAGCCGPARATPRWNSRTTRAMWRCIAAARRVGIARRPAPRGSPRGRGSSAAPAPRCGNAAASGPTARRAGSRGPRPRVRASCCRWPWRCRRWNSRSAASRDRRNRRRALVIRSDASA